MSIIRPTPVRPNRSERLRSGAAGAGGCGAQHPKMALGPATGALAACPRRARRVQTDSCARGDAAVRHVGLPPAESRLAVRRVPDPLAHFRESRNGSALGLRPGRVRTAPGWRSLMGDADWLTRSGHEMMARMAKSTLPSARTRRRGVTKPSRIESSWPKSPLGPSPVLPRPRSPLYRTLGCSRRHEARDRCPALPRGPVDHPLDRGLAGRRSSAPPALRDVGERLRQGGWDPGRRRSTGPR